MRHFYGHGAFIQGGTVLATTGMEIGSGEGRVGLWSRADGDARIAPMAGGYLASDGSGALITLTDGGAVPLATRDNHLVTIDGA